MATKYGNGGNNTINGTNNDDFIYGKGGRDMLYGLGGNDYIDGGIGDDFIFGGEGNDTLFGGKGADTMQGGLGADQFKGGKGSDTADYSDATSGLTVYLKANAAYGYASGDTFTSMENVTGGAYQDFLQATSGGKAFGGAGNDYLYGSGNSGTADNGGILRGDAGVDTLRMDYGATKAWIQLGQGYDTLVGFIENQDKLLVDLAEFGLGSSLDSNELVNSDSITALGGHAQFIYEGDAGRLWFDQNGSTAGGLYLIAEFSGSTIYGDTLDLGDFEIV